MKRLLPIVLIAAAVLFCPRAWSQTSFPVTQGNIAASSTNCSTSFSCVWQNNLSANAGTTTIAISGTFTATLLVEESNNGGQTWATAATLSAVGTTTYSTNGFSDIRVRCSAFTSGTATVTINTGLLQVQSVVSGGGGSGVSSYPSLTNTPSVDPRSYGAKFDSGTDAASTTTSGSNVVTCSNCKFVTGTAGTNYPPAKVGHVFFATDSTGAAQGANSCLDNPTILFGGLNQTTISSVDSDTQIHVVGNSGTTSTALACIAWGTDDTTALNNAWSQNGTSCTTSLLMPMGNAIFSAPIFQKVTANGVLCSSSIGTAYPGQALRGSGNGSTKLMPTPGFNFAPIANARGTNGAICNVFCEISERFQVFGLGVRCSSTVANAALYNVGLGAALYGIAGVGWCARGGGATLSGMYVNGPTDYLNYTGTNFFGSIGLDINSTNVFLGDSFFSSNTFVTTGGCVITLEGSSSLFSTSNILNNCVQLLNNATLNSLNTTYNNFDVGVSDIIFGGNNSVVNLIGNDTLSGGANGIGEQAGANANQVRATNSNITGGSSFAVSLLVGNSFYDLGGNVITAGTSGIWNGLGSFVADGHSIKAIGTGTCTSSATLGLRISGSSTTGTAVPTACTSTTIDAGVPMNGVRTVKALFVNAGTGGFNASSGVVTVLKNGVSQTMTCTLGTGTFCQDATHSITTADGDLISVQMTTQATETLANVRVIVDWQ